MKSLRLRVPGRESLFVAVLVLFGFAVGARPIADNSMLTHLRTGIDMVSGGGIPRVDPYSFTALGDAWTVQSWLAEWIYGWAQRLGGFRLVVLLQALLIAALVWLTTRLTRCGTPLRTALASGTVVAMAAPSLSPRPLLFGLLCLVLTITVVERRMSPWLLVPVVWLWVNTHGSFPLGLVWLGARAVGELFDWRSWPRETARYFWGFLGSLAVAALNPLGARLLSFPLTVLTKQDALSAIVEWRAPEFDGIGGRLTLLFLAVALTLLVRARLTWRDVIPVVVFLAAGLLAARNLAAAAFVLAPVLGRVVRLPESAPRRRGPTTSEQRFDRVLLVVVGAAFALFTVAALVRDPLSLQRYPVEAATFLDERGLLDGTHRVAHQDFVGNYLAFRFGRDVPVFIDDRVDMYPLAVSSDYRTLLGGRPSSLAVLDRYRIDAVVWADDRPLVAQLELSPQWEEIYRDDEWVAFARAGLRLRGP